MALPTSPMPVLRFVGSLAGTEEELAAARWELTQWYGQIDAISEVIPVNFTEYYNEEMGDGPKGFHRGSGGVLGTIAADTSGYQRIGNDVGIYDFVCVGAGNQLGSDAGGAADGVAVGVDGSAGTSESA